MSADRVAGPDDVRARAAEMVRALAADLRSARSAQGSSADDVGRLVLAAVESVETLAGTAEALLPTLPAQARGPLQLAIRGAWERLESTGIRRDGAVGEAVDLTRHRVVKARGAGAQKVSAVIAPGITFGDRRIREAAVTASGEEDHGPRRD